MVYVIINRLTINRVWERREMKKLREIVQFSENMNREIVDPQRIVAGKPTTFASLWVRHQPPKKRREYSKEFHQNLRVRGRDLSAREANIKRTMLMDKLTSSDTGRKGSSSLGRFRNKTGIDPWDTWGGANLTTKRMSGREGVGTRGLFMHQKRGEMLFNPAGKSGKKIRGPYTYITRNFSQSNIATDNDRREENPNVKPTQAQLIFRLGTVSPHHNTRWGKIGSKKTKKLQAAIAARPPTIKKSQAAPEARDRYPSALRGKMRHDVEKKIAAADTSPYRRAKNETKNKLLDKYGKYLRDWTKVGSDNDLSVVGDSRYELPNTRWQKKSDVKLSQTYDANHKAAESHKEMWRNLQRKYLKQSNPALGKLGKISTVVDKRTDVYNSNHSLPADVDSAFLNTYSRARQAGKYVKNPFMSDNITYSWNTGKKKLLTAFQNTKTHIMTPAAKGGFARDNWSPSKSESKKVVKNVEKDTLAASNAAFENIKPYNEPKFAKKFRAILPKTNELNKLTTLVKSAKTIDDASTLKYHTKLMRKYGNTGIPSSTYTNQATKIGNSERIRGAAVFVNLHNKLRKQIKR